MPLSVGFEKELAVDAAVSHILARESLLAALSTLERALPLGCRRLEQLLSDQRLLHVLSILTDLAISGIK